MPAFFAIFEMARWFDLKTRLPAPKSVTDIVAFGSDLDAATMNVISKGQRNVEILKQAQSDPFKVEDQIAIIYAGSKNLLRAVPVEKVKEFEADYIQYLNAKHKDTLDTLKAGKLTDEVIDVLTSAAKEISAKYA